MAHDSLLDGATQPIRSMVDLKEERDIDSLFTSSKTTAPVNTIAGIDDCELISFPVVQDDEKI